MNENASPSPAPENDEAAPKKTRTRGIINAKYLDEIELVRAILVAARLLENIAPLTARECPPEEIDTLEKTADLLHATALKAVGRRAARKMDTQEEEIARTTLLNSINPIRTGAKRKYRGEGSKAARSAYFVNEPTNVSLERLLFIGGSLLEKLTPQPAPSGTGTIPPQDTLKGITDDDLEALKNACEAYLDKDLAQTATTNETSQLRQQVEDIYDQLQDQRIDLQLAADQAWPHTNPAHAATRQSFKIPASRPAIE
jgi:hypothetical protein